MLNDIVIVMIFQKMFAKYIPIKLFSSLSFPIRLYHHSDMFIGVLLRQRKFWRFRHVNSFACYNNKLPWIFLIKRDQRVMTFKLLFQEIVEWIKQQILSHLFILLLGLTRCFYVEHISSKCFVPGRHFKNKISLG